jgi:hypothetical protein
MVETPKTKEKKVRMSNFYYSLRHFLKKLNPRLIRLNDSSSG